MATKALKKKLNKIEVNIQNLANQILHVLTFLFSLPVNNNTLEKKDNQIKNNIKSMGGKVLQAFIGLNIVINLGLPII